MHPILVARDLRVRYPRAAGPALAGVSFSLAAGETLLLLGPSGSGKSTVGLCLAGLIPTSVPAIVEGQVLLAAAEPSQGYEPCEGWDLRDAAELTVGERTALVGMVFQDPEAQFCMLTVEDEVAFGLENMAVPPAEMDGRIAEALALVGLSERRHERSDRLSGGQKQRLALACVLARRPAVLFLDEPTANLDPATRREFFGVLGRLRREQPALSMIVVEHVLDDLIGLVDRVLLLGPGGILVAEGPPAAIFSSAGDELDSLGIWLPQVTALGRKLRQAGVPLSQLPLTVAEAAAILGPHVRQRRLASASAGSLAVETAATAAKSACADCQPAHEGGLRSSCSDLGRPQAPAVGSLAVETAATAAKSACADYQPAHACADYQPAHASADCQPAHEGGLRSSCSDLGRPQAPAIAVRDLSFAYGDGPPVLRDVSLEVPAGCFCALLGANGSGKTTLASHFAAILQPPAGRVYLFGDDIASLTTAEIAERVGYVFQNPEHQFVESHVDDELAYSLRVRRRPPAEIAGTVDSLLAGFGLAPYRRQNPFALSQGQKRRLSVATMLAVGQRLLVLDEPTFGQDRHTSHALMERLAGLLNAGVTIFVVTHDMQLVADYVKNVVVLAAGAVRFAGPTPALFADEELLRQTALRPLALHELARALGIGYADGTLPLSLRDWLPFFGLPAGGRES